MKYFRIERLFRLLVFAALIAWTCLPTVAQSSRRDATAPEGASSVHGRTGVIFYADPKASEQMWAPLFDALRREVVRESAEFPLPDDAELMRASALLPGADFEHVLAVKLTGRCDVVEQAYRPLKPGPLGWVLQVSGEIQPYVYVDCTRLVLYLTPKTLGMNGEQRREAVSEAIAKIVVHEWIHVATQCAHHESHGIRQAEFSGAELTGGGDLGRRARVSGGR